MREEEITLIKEVYFHVLPNVVYTNEFEKFFEQNVDSENLQIFVTRLRETISKIADITRRTDYQIFLNEIQRRINPRVK